MNQNGKEPGYIGFRYDIANEQSVPGLKIAPKAIILSGISELGKPHTPLTRGRISARRNDGVGGRGGQQPERQRRYRRGRDRQCYGGKEADIDNRRGRGEAPSGGPIERDLQLLHIRVRPDGREGDNIRRDDPQGRVLRACREERGAERAYNRWQGAACDPAGALHRRRRGDDDREGVGGAIGGFVDVLCGKGLKRSNNNKIFILYVHRVNSVGRGFCIEDIKEHITVMWVGEGRLNSYENI